jgi:hypothetical protein
MVLCVVAPGISEELIVSIFKVEEYTKQERAESGASLSLYSLCMEGNERGN